jgi:hypothetical protein
MSEFLDELARTLSRPMPRSKAVRVLGGALVTAAVPLLRAAPGSGARTQPAPKKCADYREGPTCPKLCCRDCPPVPSGGNPGVLKWCCNKDDECDFDDPSEQYRCGRVRCKPASTCGPDITDELEKALARVRSEFGRWGGLKRYNACLDLVTLPGAAISWDIRELGPGGRQAFTSSYGGCDTCGNSVQVGRDCHYSGSVNYVVYGVMMRLCHDYMAHEDSVFADWFSSEEMLELIYMHKNKTGTPAANFQASNNWALSGYHSGSLRPIPKGDRPDCKKRCSKSYSGPGLTVNWLPFVIGPRR